MCGYLGAGCIETDQSLASRVELETGNTSSILESIKDFESLTRSGEVDLNVVIRTKLPEILKRHSIIVEGRSAFMLLDREDIVKTFLNASLEDRIKHVAERRGIPLEEASEDVERSDEERIRLLQRLFKKNYLEAGSFDFSVSTSSKTFSRVADIIAEFLRLVPRKPKFHRFPSSPVSLFGSCYDAYFVNATMCQSYLQNPKDSIKSRTSTTFF